MIIKHEAFSIQFSVQACTVQFFLLARHVFYLESKLKFCYENLKVVEPKLIKLNKLLLMPSLKPVINTKY